MFLVTPGCHRATHGLLLFLEAALPFPKREGHPIKHRTQDGDGLPNKLNPMVCYTDDLGLLATGTHGADEHPVVIKTAQVTCCRNESARDSSGSSNYAAANVLGAAYSEHALLSPLTMEPQWKPNGIPMESPMESQWNPVKIGFTYFLEKRV